MALRSSALYLAANPVEAEIVKDYLAAHGIAVSIRGVFAWGGVGDLPIAEAYPRLYLERETDRPRAAALLRDYERGASRGSRICPRCGEASPDNFLLCWNCGAENS
ncbi:MAG: DUF2007 domain-containing protein [Hydrocarboniphaga effusa]|nr:DUF2007 domain-containing protein [Hydrocarboniphaga effusa]